MRGLSHVIFRLGCGETSAAGLHGVKPGAKIDLGFPAPRKCRTVPGNRAGKDLLPVRISNFVKTTFSFLVHSVTLRALDAANNEHQTFFSQNSGWVTGYLRARAYALRFCVPESRSEASILPSWMNANNSNFSS